MVEVQKRIGHVARHHVANVHQAAPSKLPVVAGGLHDASGNRPERTFFRLGAFVELFLGVHASGQGFFHARSEEGE